MASASVHTAEIFTTGVSGLSHLKFKNIDKRLFVRIVFTGILGAVTGAYLLSAFLDGKMVKPYVAAYLLILGLYILYKGHLHRDRKSVVSGKSVSVRVDLSGRRIIQKKKIMA